MKSFACFFSLAFFFATIVTAQNVITPTNHIELFNGEDFSGFTFCMKNEADPLKTWSVTNGVIHCNGAAVGYLRTKQSFQNYQLTVEWRFVKIAPKADNTGVLFHIQQPDKVWPMCVQFQGKHEHQGDLFLMAGAESKEHKGMDANTPVPLRYQAEKPVGDWNEVKIWCMNGIYTNGVSTSFITTFENNRPVNYTTDCTLTNGAIGIQSEGADFEIRKISLDQAMVAPSYHGLPLGYTDILDAQLRAAKP